MLIPKPEGYQERERRPRREGGERRPRRDNREADDRRRPRRAEHGNDEYHDPLANREPKGFTDALDHGDF